MKPIFLSIQATYSSVFINLYQEKSLLAFHVPLPHETHASSHLIPFLDTLLKEHSLTLKDLAFIAIDKGPGAFTSLRAAVATVNGIAFAHKIPLIGIDSLEALCWETLEKINAAQVPHADMIATLLNAYNNDVYFLLTQTTDPAQPKTIEVGCCNINALLEKINTIPCSSLIITGNGATLHHALIQTTLNPGITLHHIPQATPTAHAIGMLGLRDYLELKEYCYKIEPNYLKTQNFAIRTQPNKPPRS